MANYDLHVYGVREVGARRSVEIRAGGALVALFVSDADVQIFVPPAQTDGFAPAAGPDYSLIQLDPDEMYRLAANDATFDPVGAPDDVLPKMKAECLDNDGTYEDHNG